MPKAQGGPPASEEIIELTDIIEHGPGTGASGASGQGVDLSFERELEDLFADAGEGDKAAGQTEEAVAGLHLPDEDQPGPGQTDEVDLEGLDALLEEAQQGETVQPAPQAAIQPAQTAPGVDVKALEDRLDGLEAKMAGLAESREAAEPGADLAELVAKLDERMSAVEGLAQSIPAPVDQEALAGAIKEQLLAEMPEMPAPQDPVDLEALAAQIKDQLAAELPAAQASGSDADTLDMIAKLDERLSALEARLEDMGAVQEPEEALGQDQETEGLATSQDLKLLELSLREELLAEIKKAVPAAAAQVIREEIQALVREMD
jgi:hypothetical protein